MPLVAGAGALGIACGAAAGCFEPLGFASWLPIGIALCASLPAFCGVFNPLGGTPCIAVGPLITPGGQFTTLPGAPLGILLAAASLSLDAAGIEKWINVANCLVGWVGQYATYSGIGLVAFVGIPPGPVTGSGLVTFSNEIIGPDLATAAGILPDDATGIAKWTAVGAAIITTIKACGMITPSAMVNPGTGGPVTGAGTFS